ERTFATLFLIGFRPRDIYLAKYAAVLMPCLSLLLVPLPAYAVASAMGIASFANLLWPMVLLMATCAAITSIGLFVSAISAKPGDALFTMLALMFVWFGCTLYFLPESAPFNGVFAVFDTATISSTSARLISLAVHLAMAGLFTGGTLLVLPHVAYEREKRTRRLRHRPRRVFMDPAVHFVYANATGLAAVLRLYRLTWPAAILFAVAAFYYPWLLLLFVFLLCYDTASSAVKVANDGVLLELLLMPLNDRRAARVLLTAYARHTVVYLPAIAMGSILALAKSLNGYRVFFVLHDFHTSIISFMLFPIMILAFCCAVLAGVLAATNLGLQAAGPVRAGIAAFFTVIELTFCAVFVAIMPQIYYESIQPERYTIAFAAGTLFTFGLFFPWYYRRYFRSLRAALFEEDRVKQKNW
ncbi:MAG: hypothetical protein KJ052_13195, partial [Candidatus Hydrogenedentes bacterium]|nr:hypothetical protein [Candidatus Hydrogenedentota bacterium]